MLLTWLNNKFTVKFENFMTIFFFGNDHSSKYFSFNHYDSLYSSIKLLIILLDNMPLNLNSRLSVTLGQQAYGITCQ